MSHLVTGSWQALLLANFISGVINAEFISFKGKRPLVNWRSNLEKIAMTTFGVLLEKRPGLTTEERKLFQISQSRKRPHVSHLHYTAFARLKVRIPQQLSVFTFCALILTSTIFVQFSLRRKVTVHFGNAAGVNIWSVNLRDAMSVR